jgi:hypothetical protein
MRIAGLPSCAFVLIVMPVEADEPEKPEQRFALAATGGRAIDNLRGVLPLLQKTMFRIPLRNLPLIAKALCAEFSDAQPLERESLSALRAQAI